MLSLSDALANLSNLPMISNMMTSGFFDQKVMNNIWSFIWFVVAYAILFIVIPAKVLNLKLCDGEFLDNAMISIIVSQVTLASIVYVLGFMKIYNRLTLGLSIIFIVLFYVKFKNRISFRQKLNDFVFVLSDILNGQLKFPIIVRDYFGEKLSNISHGLKRFIKWYFNKNVVYHILGTVSLLVLAVRRGYFAMTSQAFPTSDVSVHTSWINFLDADFIFSDGIYPFAMHNIVSSFAKITFIDVVTVMRFIGPLNAVFMGVVLMAVISRVFRSPGAAVVTGMIYCLSSFGTGAVIDRVFFSLPQEYGMVFIIPTGYFMVKFLEDQRNIDLIAFSFSACMTVSAHFYNAFFSVPLCFCLVLFYIPILFHKKVFVKMVLAVILAAVLSVGPMLVGLTLGYHWQGSLDWAVSMMEKGSDSGEQSSSETAEKEKSGGEKAEDEEQGPDFIEKSVNSFKFTMKNITDYWGYVVYISSVVSIGLGALVLLTTSKKKQAKVAIGLGLYMLLFNYIIMNPTTFGLPALITGDRSPVYLVYLGAIMIGVPFGLFWIVFEERLKPVRWVGSVAFVTAALFVIVFMGSTFQSSAYFRLSYSSVTEQYYRIKETHRKDTWTIVSTVDELALTRNKGWHYEMWEFIFRMEQYDPTRVIQIPTEYVYFVIEKRPLKYADTNYLGQAETLYPRVSKDAANQLLSEQTVRTRKKSDYYGIYENRLAIMSKAYFWAEKYMSYFPDQMSVYYEDMDIIIYEIKQNMYALNNFAIDYGYNTITMEQWLIEHPEALGQTAPAVSDSDLAAGTEENAENTAETTP
ncbi:MAG: hypothetical protein IJM51_03370 [Clostridia bacterium]|nr:hypothetical protein [Clostridia bacterium]